MNTQTIRSLALSVLAAIATLGFAAMSVPTQANGLCLHRGLFAVQVQAPNAGGRMVQLGVPGSPSVVFAAGS